MSLEVISPLVIVSGALLLILLERLFPYDKGCRLFREEFWNDLLLYTFIQSYLLGLVIALIIRWVDASTGISRLEAVSDWPLIAQVLLFFFTHEIYQYWFHRLEHRNRYVWRIHEAQHATPEVDWLVGSRAHALEILISQTIEFAPIFLLGAAPEVALIKGMLDALWGMYNHSNIDVRSGWLIYVINGPELHRWHHAKGLPPGSVNLATKLSLWDVIWGTFYLPKDHRPECYGLDGEADFPRNNYIRQQLYAFRPFEENE